MAGSQNIQMDIEEDYNWEMIAHEAFIRRAASVDGPFMLKGSYVTRQYFPAGITRIPADLDWIYTLHLDDKETAQQVFSEWVTRITELDLNDGVQFRSFRENDFWRMMDYAMADDFPTVNTDILCSIDGEELLLRLDVSFNLPIGQPSAPLLYTPLRGDSFVVPSAVPLSLQVSWKIHQTLVRPRFKDLFDLTYLVQHPSFNGQTLADAMQALIDECRADNVDLTKLKYFLTYDFKQLFPNNSLVSVWKAWRYNDTHRWGGEYWVGRASNITEDAVVPIALPQFLLQLSQSLTHAGFTVDLMNDLPISTVQPRKAPAVTAPVQPPAGPSLANDKGDNLWTMLRNIFRK